MKQQLGRKYAFFQENEVALLSCQCEPGKSPVCQHMLSIGEFGFDIYLVTVKVPSSPRCLYLACMKPGDVLGA